MVKTIALGLLIAGITPIALANSTVINMDNQQQVVDLAQPKIAHPGLSSACKASDLAVNCLANNALGKLEEIHQRSEIISNSDLWLRQVANILLPNALFNDCQERSLQKTEYVNGLLDYGNRTEQLFNSQQQTSLLYAVSVEPTLNNTELSQSLLGKLINPGCVFSWQQRVDREAIALKPVKSTKLDYQYESFQSSSPASISKPLSPKLPKLFPKLSRSSLIVSFPQANSSFIPKNTKLANPAPETKRIASPFGWRIRPYSNQLQFHQGIDYGAPYGSPVVAIGNGIVTKVVSGCADFGNLFCGDQLGNWIEIDHGNGLIGTYGHLKNSSIIVKAGTIVSKNQNIAQVGSSGWSTGAHLDLRLKVNGKHEDPAKYVMAIDLNKTDTNKY
ncbi:MAG TPA: M23 family metallopeptidase [Coleofasciculaceae cyanobacterium]|jgi:murein DD-endopeptidase MepM/ murein hydrolase activator NlpD